MIRIEDVRGRAQRVLPNTKYQEYGDSPTIKFYTDWNVFEKAFSSGDYTLGSFRGVRVVDAVPSFSFEVAANRALAHHFSKMERFLLWDGSHHFLLDSGDAHTVQHVLFCVDRDSDVFIEDLSSNSSKSVTIDLLVRPGVSINLEHLVHGRSPHYVHVRVHLGASSTFSGNLAVVGRNAHVHYEIFLNGAASSAFLSGGSVGGRSDVVTDAFVRSDGNKVSVKHVLFSAPGDFLVHRGVVHVSHTSHRADADMDSAFLTTGGLAVSVPELEILTDDVVHAAHRSREISPDAEQLFYVQSRGVSVTEFMALYVDSIVSSRIGRLAENEKVKEAVKSFAESLPR